MPRCLHCTKQSSLMFQCKSCQNQRLCVGCIQLERHSCPNLTLAKDRSLEQLEKQLHFEKPRKLEKL